MNLLISARTETKDLILRSITCKLSNGKEVKIAWDLANMNICRTSIGFGAHCKDIYISQDTDAAATNTDKKDLDPHILADKLVNELAESAVVDVEVQTNSQYKNDLNIFVMMFEDNENMWNKAFPIYSADTFDLQRNHIEIVDDIEVNYDEYDEQSNTQPKLDFRIEAWFDVDKKFGLDTSSDDSEWLNMYGKYNLYTDELYIMCVVSNDFTEWEFKYIPTQPEKKLIIEMLTEVIQKKYNQTLIEYCENSKEE